MQTRDSMDESLSPKIFLPKITIVTPSYNQGDFIEEALLSVQQQDYPNLEDIVVDGGSTDQTLQILSKYRDHPGWQHLRWISEPDRGQSDALNKGFRLATGEIIGWLNSDDRYRPAAFATLARTLRSHPDADILYGDYTLMDQLGNVRRIRREIEFSRFILQYHRVLYIPTTSTFFRRRIFDDGNWIDESFHYAMDYEFFLRLSQCGYSFRHIRFVMADFRLHPQSKTEASPQKQWQEHDRVAKQCAPVLKRLRGQALQSIAFRCLRTTAAALRYSQKLLRGYYFEQPRTAAGVRANLP